MAIWFEFSLDCFIMKWHVKKMAVCLKVGRVGTGTDVCLGAVVLERHWNVNGA